MIEHLHINPNWKNIGVRLSGGADSSIIYYALCYHYKDRNDVNIYPITRYTDKKWWYNKGAKIVIDKVTELTGKQPADWFVAHPNDFKNQKELPNYEPGTAKLEEATSKYNLDAIYIGLTKNPPVDDMKNYFLTNITEPDLSLLISYIDSRDSSRDVQTEKTIRTVMSCGKRLTQIVPFADLDKKSVYKMYEYYNVLDTLYPFTYSCETIPESKNDTLVHCGYCFFCAERLWGFGRII